MTKGTFILGMPIRKTHLSLKRHMEILRRAERPELAKKLKEYEEGKKGPHRMP